MIRWGRGELEFPVLDEKVSYSLVIEIVILGSHLELELAKLEENIRIDVEADQLTVGILGFLDGRGKGRDFLLALGTPDGRTL